MKVWLLHMESYGDTAVYSEDTDVCEIPFVRTEFGYLDGEYEDEREEFKEDVAEAIRRGYGEASIEERFWVELVTVKSL